jgi:sortase A
MSLEMMDIDTKLEEGMRMRNRNKFRDVRYFLLRLVLSLGALASILVMIYPFVVSSVNEEYGKVMSAIYLNKLSKRSKEEQARIEEERAVAAKNLAHKLKDPFSKESLENAENALDLPKPEDFYEKHMLGLIYLPKINQALPIFDNTGDMFISRGAGWMANTSLPFGGKNNHTALSSHRGLEKARLFTDLPKYQKGDVFIVMVHGDYHAYKVAKKVTVEPDDVSHIKPESGRDLVSLITCTPYALNTHRLIVTGERVPFKPTMIDDIAKMKNRQNLKNYAWMAAPVLAALAVVAYLTRLVIVLRRRSGSYRLIFRLLNETGVALDCRDVVYQLYLKNGKRVAKWGEDPIQLTQNADGVFTFAEVLPGGDYVLKPVGENAKRLPSFKVVPKHLKLGIFSLKRRRKRMLVKQVREVDGVPNVWLKNK